jgi:drug/metabolite transporter (DMT)-like permease
LIYLILVSLIWAFSFGLIGSQLRGVDSVFVAFARLLLSLLVFLPLWRPRRLPRGLLWQVLAIGGLQFGVMYLAYIYSYRFLQSHQVAILTIFTPLLVTLLSDALVRRPMWGFLAGAALAVAGAGVVEYRGIAGQGALLKGLLLVQLANLCYAAGQVWYRRLRRRQPQLKDREIFAWLYIGAVIVSGALAAATVDFAAVRLTWTQAGALVYLGAVASGLCFFLWNVGATRVSSGTLAVANNLKIPLAVAVSLLVFGEATNVTRLLIGGALIGAGLALNELITRRRRKAILAIGCEPS